MNESMEGNFEQVITEDCDVYDKVPFDKTKMPHIALPLILKANETLNKINRVLCSTPAFIEIIKTAFSTDLLAAVLTSEQKEQIANGIVRIMAKKDGSLLATLVDPNTNHIVSTIPLQKIHISPELGQALVNYSAQVQMAQIAEKIEFVQKAVEDVRLGQEHDRLSTAASCQQKFLQVSKFQNIGLKSEALLRIAMDAEDSRNLLMKSQKANMVFIEEQPESLWGKIVKGATPKEIALRINEIRESLHAINSVSLVEAMAYQEMGEIDAAQQSLKYYGEFIKSTFLDKPGVVERLDQIDDSPENYWSQNIPDIESRIAALPEINRIDEIEGHSI